MITQKILKEYFDYQNGDLIRIKATRSQSTGKKAGWITLCNGRQYRKMSFSHKTYYVHRMIFLWHHGYQPKYIDHINTNSLDNRIENLREATQSQNCANQNIKKNNTSGFKGVKYRKDLNKWSASVMVNRKNIALGCFETIDQAVEAYKNGAEKYFGEFARTEQANNRFIDKAAQ